MDKYGFKGSEQGVQEFSTGAVRDKQDVSKGRYDLISPLFLRRLAVVLAKGAEKYGERNWEAGIPMARSMDSLLRHSLQALEGQKDEDHLGHAACNLMFLIHTEEMVNRGMLDEELANLPDFTMDEHGEADHVFSPFVQVDGTENLPFKITVYNGSSFTGSISTTTPEVKEAFGEDLDD